MESDVLCLLRDAASVSFPACVSRLTSMSRYLQAKLMLWESLDADFQDQIGEAEN